MLTACYVDEFYDRVLRCFVILSLMAASYVDEFYDRVLWCRVSWPRAKQDESAGHVLKCRMSWPRVKNDESADHWLNVEWVGRVPKWCYLKITKSHEMDGWFADRVHWWQVLWPRDVILSLMAASYVDELYDRMLWYWVLSPLAILTNFRTACYDVLWYWLLWPRVMLWSFVTACLDVEWVGRVPKRLVVL